MNDVDFKHKIISKIFKYWHSWKQWPPLVISHWFLHKCNLDKWEETSLSTRQMRQNNYASIKKVKYMWGWGMQWFQTSYSMKPSRRRPKLEVQNSKFRGEFFSVILWIFSVKGENDCVIPVGLLQLSALPASKDHPSPFRHLKSDSSKSFELPATQATNRAGVLPPQNFPFLHLL